MGCTQAEILRLLELIEDEVFGKKPKTVKEAYDNFIRLKFVIRERSLAEVRALLGL